jgi:hypothetical protein
MLAALPGEDSGRSPVYPGFFFWNISTQAKLARPASEEGPPILTG